MSFGQHQYQHRFYNNEPHKKTAAGTPTLSNVLPISSFVRQPYYTPQVQKDTPHTNNLNLKVRAGEIEYNQPGWEGIRLKSYVTDKYSQNYRHYQNDRQVIERFKREAEQHRRRARFNSHQVYLEPTPEPVLPQIRLRTQPAHLSIEQSRIEERHRMQENPEMHDPYRYDVGIMARMPVQSRSNHHHQRGKSEREELEQRKLREYKKKYSILKSKLKEELRMHRQEDAPEVAERANFSRIEHLMSDVSERIAKNALIFNEGLRVERELRQARKNSNSPISRLSRASHHSPPPVSREQGLTTPTAQEHLPSPKIVYSNKQLSKSYHELQQLKLELGCINKKISNKYSQL